MREHCARVTHELPLKRYLRDAFPLVSERVLQNALRRRDIKRHGQRLSPDDLIRDGDILEIYIAEEYLCPPIPIAYSGCGIIAVIKPRGIPSVGEGSMQCAVESVYPTAHSCHRLDTQTGGLLLFSLNETVHEALLYAFRHRKIEKKYRCIVRGKPIRDCDMLKAYLLKNSITASVAVFDEPCKGALPIQTGYRVIGGNAEACELEIDLITGRTHQIRAHMAHIGHPILGDDKYGDRMFNRSRRAKYLHLWSSGIILRFSDGPLRAIDGLEITSPPPWD